MFDFFEFSIYNGIGHLSNLEVQLKYGEVKALSYSIFHAFGDEAELENLRDLLGVREVIELDQIAEDVEA